jgi:glycosyltransferase involved in cell wall biosynthesis
MVRTRAPKILIASNGNLTGNGGSFFVHHEIAAFLRETLDVGLKTEYAVVILDGASEQIKNLADDKFPEKIRLCAFNSLSTLPRWRRFFARFREGAKMLFAVMRQDFVYCYYPGTLPRGLILFCRLLHRPYGLYVRGEIPDIPQNRRILADAKFILATGISNVTRVVPEYKSCHEIVPMCSILQEDMELIPKTSFGTPLHGLFVGRVEKNKGVFELFEAVAELKRRGIAVKMTLVGTYGAEIEEAVKRLEISDMVVLAGLAKDPEALKEFYRNADFFCLPTYTEGFPRVLYEAMAHGLPCVTTLVGGIPTRMHAGENCLALKARDVDSIVEAISALASDSELAKRLSQASLDTFAYWRQRFGGSSHAIQLKGLITAALGGTICH